MTLTEERTDELLDHGQMTIQEHLAELRSRLIKSPAPVVAGMAVGFALQRGRRERPTIGQSHLVLIGCHLRPSHTTQRVPGHRAGSTGVAVCGPQHPPIDPPGKPAAR